MIKIITVIIIFLSINSFAAISENVTVAGTVEYMSDHDVTLIQDGNKFVIPRALIPKTIKIEPKKEIEVPLKTNLLEKVSMN